MLCCRRVMLAVAALGFLFQGAAAAPSLSTTAGGTIRIPNPPWHFSGADVGLRGGAKYRGEDNREVLAEVLGYDDATLDALEADGILSSRMPSSAR